MATSNVQLQIIQQKLQYLGYSRNTVRPDGSALILSNQIQLLKQHISTIDKTDVQLYAANLEKLHILQTRYDALNSDQVNALLQQKIQLLEQLTG